MAAEAGSSPVIFMGHGSEHAADESYERLECVLAQVTENDVYVATVEGSVTIDDVIGRMRASRHKDVYKRQIRGRRGRRSLREFLTAGSCADVSP